MPRGRSTSFPNRTDRTQPDNPRQLAVQGIPGGQYGDEARQQAEQRAVPEGSTPLDTGATAGATAPSGGGQPQARPAPAAAPGSLPWLHPTNRPDEPVTAGLPFGPGPGPEALSSPPPPLVSDTLASLAASPNASASVAAMAAVARSLGV